MTNALSKPLTDKRWSDLQCISEVDPNTFEVRLKLFISKAAEIRRLRFLRRLSNAVIVGFPNLPGFRIFRVKIYLPLNASLRFHLC